MQDDEALGSPLSDANRLQQRAAGVGFDWPDARGPLAKVKEETAELEDAGKQAGRGGKGKRERLAEEIGDLLFAVVNLARKLGIDPDHALARANDKFRRRFAALQQLAQQRGLVMGRASLEQLDALWDEVKRRR
jgi:ATP diphosphatase